MNNSVQDYLFKPSERMRDLQLLEEIERNPRISQRELSHKFGIALGVTNTCIKRMARRGLIRLKGFPPRRIAYYLTPVGAANLWVSSKCLKTIPATLQGLPKHDLSKSDLFLRFIDGIDFRKPTLAVALSRHGGYKGILKLVPASDRSYLNELIAVQESIFCEGAFFQFN